MEIIKTNFFQDLEDDERVTDWSFYNENVEHSQKKTLTKRSRSTLTETTQSFGDLGVAKPLSRACEASGYLAPTLIQSEAIPIILKGRDCIINAQTGSGKTCAFSLPILHRLVYRDKKIQVTRAIILSPTRELSQQTLSMVRTFAQFMDISCRIVMGGADTTKETKELQQAPDILIATPGRLLDHIKNSKDVSFEYVDFLVFDEADRLLDSGFIEEVKEILKELPEDRQTILASATMGQSVSELVQLALKHPVKVGKTGIPETLKHVLIRLQEEWDRTAVLIYLLKHHVSEKVLVFFKTKAECHKAVVLLRLLDYKVGEMHGNLTQKQRLDVLTDFQTEEIKVLVATDLAARGLDLPVEAVINMGVPDEDKKLLHRIGRTARAGQIGLSITLCDPEERSRLRKLVKAVPALKVERKSVEKAHEEAERLVYKVRKVLADEKVEKEMEDAEREVKRGNNLIEYAEEIYNRPKKEWIRKPREKNEKEEKVKENRRIENKIENHKSMIKLYKKATKGMKNLKTHLKKHEKKKTKRFRKKKG